MSEKTWFITGASKGFGHEWAQAALDRGDRVAVTSRNPASLAPLADAYGDRVLPIGLDPADAKAAADAVQRAAEHFGSLDVVINNAGYGLFGMVEEVSEDQARDQLEANLFGALWVTQAAIPIMREQGGGHIIQVSSIAGVFALPGLGIYHASKWALEGFTSSLVQEVKGFGIKVTLVEPAGYATDWDGPSAVRAEPLHAYDDFRANLPIRPASRRAIPSATRAAILAVVDAPEPPLRVFFGKGPLDLMRSEYQNRIAEWERWDALSQAAHGF